MGNLGAAFVAASALALVAALASCDGEPDRVSTGPTATRRSSESPGVDGAPVSPRPARGTVTVGFVGDLHFEAHLARLLTRRGSVLGPRITAAMRRSDLMVANLETSITRRGRLEPKEFNFRASPRSLAALDELGVDVVSLANNHAVDYGRVGLRDTLAAVRHSPVPVVGIGENLGAAFRPHTVSIRGTTIAVVAASTKDERTAHTWSAGVRRPGVAVAVQPRKVLLREVRRSAERADVVVVYLHWGRQYHHCPDRKQRSYASTLAAAGADVVLGSHAHVLLGAGWLGDTYVGYGLGNFLWYNQNSVSTGILQLTIRDGRVAADSFAPAHIDRDGRPRLLAGDDRAAAVQRWHRLRTCTGLSDRRPRSAGSPSS